MLKIKSVTIIPLIKSTKDNKHLFIRRMARLGSCHTQFLLKKKSVSSSSVTEHFKEERHNLCTETHISFSINIEFH